MYPCVEGEEEMGRKNVCEDRRCCADAEFGVHTELYHFKRKQNF